MLMTSLPSPFGYDLIIGRESYEKAAEMVEEMGPSAAYEALDRVERHERSNDQSNTYFWRCVEAAVTILLNEDTRGALH